MSVGSENMETFKKIFQALTGAHKSLDKLEKDLQSELVVARDNTKEALEALRRMAQEMQWRVDNLETRVDNKADRQHDTQ